MVNNLQCEGGGIDPGKPPSAADGGWTCRDCQCLIDYRRDLGLGSPEVYRRKSKDKIAIRSLRIGLWGWCLPGVLTL